MTSLIGMKCAGEPCVCVVSIETAVQKEDKYYCSEACAQGHSEGSSGCGHQGCDCHG